MKEIVLFIHRKERIIIPSILGLLMLVALYVRLLYSEHAFWLDELTTSWVISGSFADIFSRCWMNNLSPLYYCIIYLSKSVFGFTELGLRIPGILFGVLTMPIGYIVSRQFQLSKYWSLLVVLLMSLSTPLVFFSLEVRPYPIIVFLSLVHISIFLKFIQMPAQRGVAIILALISSLIVLLHYTAISLLLVEVVIGVVLHKGKFDYSKREFWNIALQVIIPVLFLLPFADHLIYLFSQNSVLGSFIRRRYLTDIFSIISGFVEVLLLPLVLGLIAELILIRDEIDLKIKKRHIILFLWFFIPLIFHWVLTETGIATIYYYRYVSWTVVIPIIASVVVCTGYRTKLAKLVFLSVVLFSVSKPYLIEVFVEYDSRRKNFEQRLTRHEPNTFGWSSAVDLVNGLDMKVDKVYVIPGLVETRMKSIPKDKKELYEDYLLCTVNSLYRLDETYLSKAIAINDVKDIPSDMKNYLVMGWFNSDLKNSETLSPLSGSGSFKVYYIK